MKKSKKYILNFVFILLITITSFAQSKVKELEDLIGVNGKIAETEMVKRGYTYIKKNRSGNDIYMYWLKQSTNKCFISKISKGRVKAIIPTKESDCKRYKR